MIPDGILRRGQVILLTCPLLGLVFFPFSAGWAEEGSLTEGTQDAPPEEVVYSLLRGFPEAHAEKLKKGKRVKGWWTGKGFQFEDAASESALHLFLSDQIKVGARLRQAIWFQVEPGFESSLLFRGIPPARRLRLFYALPDEIFSKKQPAFIQMEILIGKKKIFETQTNTKGWKEKTVNLTLPFLLDRDFNLTIKVRSLDPEPKSFGVYGYIE